MHSWKRRNAEVESWYIFHAVSTSWVLILYFRIHYRLLSAYYVLKKNLEKSPTVLASSHRSSPALGNLSTLVHSLESPMSCFPQINEYMWYLSLWHNAASNDRVSFFLWCMYLNFFIHSTDRNFFFYKALWIVNQ